MRATVWRGTEAERAELMLALNGCSSEQMWEVVGDQRMLDRWLFARRKFEPVYWRGEWVVDDRGVPPVERM